MKLILQTAKSAEFEEMYADYVVNHLSKYSSYYRENNFSREELIKEAQIYENDENYDVYLINNDSVTVGFAVISERVPACFSIAESQAHIFEFYIKDECSYKGYGQAAFREILGSVVPGKRISLEILKNNYPALCFWRKCFDRNGLHYDYFVGVSTPEEEAEADLYSVMPKFCS